METPRSTASRTRGALIALAVTLVAFALFQFTWFGHKSPNLSSVLPASVPVVVADGATPTGGAWKLEAFFNDEHDVCMRSSVTSPVVVAPSDGPGKDVGSSGSAGCATSLPLSISGTEDETTRLIFGAVSPDATTVRLVMCDGSTSSVSPNRTGDEFGRAFFGFAVAPLTARQVVVIGPSGERIAKKTLVEARFVGRGAKRTLTTFEACDTSLLPKG
jgi:hypothetical protein